MSWQRAFRRTQRVMVPETLEASKIADYNHINFAGRIPLGSGVLRFGLFPAR